MSKAAEAKGLVDAAIAAYGRLDILVNNSGVYEFAPLEAITEAQFHKMFDINVLGLLLTTRRLPSIWVKAAASSTSDPALPPSPRRRRPSIPRPRARWTPSPACWPRSSGPRKIRVNSVNPSLTETEGTHSAGMLATEFEAGIIAQTPARPPRSAPGHRRRGGLCGLGRRALAHRREDPCRRRAPLILPG